MANYHLEIKNISRGKGRTITKAAHYISGEKLHDYYNDKTYYHKRQDVLYRDVFLPENAPPDFHNLQNLCVEIDKAEKRYDARTAREFIGSLPNELPAHELIQIVKEYVSDNFVKHGLMCNCSHPMKEKMKKNLPKTIPMPIFLYQRGLSEQMVSTGKRPGTK